VRELWFCLALIVCGTAWGVAADPSTRDTLLADDLPAAIKIKGGIARWDQVDQVLNRKVLPRVAILARFRREASAGSSPPSNPKTGLREVLKSTSVLFSDLFRISDSDYFPLTNSVLKFVPEASLQGVGVFEKSGKRLGTFAGKSRYERGGDLYGTRAYSLITFEIETPQGDFQSAGNDNLLDRFVVRWADIKSRPAVDLEAFLPP
jgi:hypothetical protein